MIAFVDEAKDIILITKIFNIIKRDNILEKQRFLLPINTNTKKRKNELIGTKLCKILYKENINNVILSNKLLKNKVLKHQLKAYKINILRGNILYQLMLPQILEKIVECKKSKIEEEKVSILTSENSEVVLNTIFDIAKKTKNFGIVTNHIYKFSKISDYLYDELGILIKITNNTKKGLLNSNIIINIDFNEEMINRYQINPKAIIINVPKKVNINSKKFSGINIKSYNIIMPEEYQLKGFNNRHVYEGIIYHKEIPTALDMLKKDNVKITDFIGKNGIINKREFLSFKY